MTRSEYRQYRIKWNNAQQAKEFSYRLKQIQSLRDNDIFRICGIYLSPPSSMQLWMRPWVYLRFWPHRYTE